MNGAEQKARGGEILRLDQDLKKVEQAAIDAFNLEVDARQEAIGGVKALFAKMIDEETMYRQRAIAALNDRISERLNYDETAFTGFVSLVWWRRYLWCIFGVRSLDWFTAKTTPATTAEQPTLDPRAAYHGEKPH